MGIAQWHMSKRGLLNEFDHEDVQKELDRELKRYVAAKAPSSYGATVEMEKYVDPPKTGRYRFIDVALSIESESEDQPYKGYGFEIKTSPSQQWKAISQLRDYRLAGYEPILVTTDHLYKAYSGEVPSFNWLSLPLKISFLEIVSANPIEFNLRSDMLHLPNELNGFFSGEK